MHKRVRSMRVLHAYVRVSMQCSYSFAPYLLFTHPGVPSFMACLLPQYPQLL